MGCCNDRNQKPEIETDLAYPPTFKRPNSVLLDIKRQYKFLEKLNHGAYSTVYSIQNLHSSEFRAVKCIPISNLPAQTLQSLSQEIQILQELDHPNTLKILEVFQDSKHIYIVTEQCKGGELFDRIILKGSFSETQAAGYMLQIVSAVVYMHSKNIMHRDLKPENIMFESQFSDSLLKIIDFGSSKHFVNGTAAKERLGSAYYIAPEVLAGNYDQKCDVWSLGVILHIMLCGSPPFSGHSNQEIFNKIQFEEPVFSSTSWQGVSKEAVSLIRSMLNKNPKFRVSADEVFQSPWLQNFRKKLLPDVIFSSNTLENLSSFTVSSKLMKASLGFIAKHLMSSQEIAEIVKSFGKIDKNGDGVLSLEEIKEAAEQCDCETALNLDQIIDRVQVGEGIKYSDFLTAAIDWNKELSKERLRKAFVEFDKDGSGSISVEELMKTLGGSQDQAHVFVQMIKEADLDGNGEIDFDEFCAFMLQRVSHPH